jgi:hypothetical protein
MRERPGEKPVRALLVAEAPDPLTAFIGVVLRHHAVETHEVPPLRAVECLRAGGWGYAFLGESNAELIRELRAAGTETVIVAHGHPSSERRLLDAGADAYFRISGHTSVLAELRALLLRLGMSEDERE